MLIYRKKTKARILLITRLESQLMVSMKCLHSRIPKFYLLPLSDENQLMASGKIADIIDYAKTYGTSPVFDNVDKQGGVYGRADITASDSLYYLPYKHIYFKTQADLLQKQEGYLLKQEVYLLLQEEPKIGLSINFNYSFTYATLPASRELIDYLLSETDSAAAIEYVKQYFAEHLNSPPCPASTSTQQDGRGGASLQHNQTMTAQGDLFDCPALPIEANLLLTSQHCHCNDRTVPSGSTPVVQWASFFFYNDTYKDKWQPLVATRHQQSLLTDSFRQHKTEGDARMTVPLYQHLAKADEVLVPD